MKQKTHTITPFIISMLIAIGSWINLGITIEQITSGQNISSVLILTNLFFPILFTFLSVRWYKSYIIYNETF